MKAYGTAFARAFYVGGSPSFYWTLFPRLVRESALNTDTPYYANFQHNSRES